MTETTKSYRSAILAVVRMSWYMIMQSKGLSIWHATKETLIDKMHYYV